MSFCSGSGKSSWPELVGKPGTEAVATIQKENPNVHAYIIPPGVLINPDIRCDRVWVFVNSNGLVRSIPKIG
ncbi:hypothetical protein RIF29_21504 [Crotalaria pallida]|uniref:Uncharacterized protein n=1 Tax=Crotalaria pallida TaxID=3830 RepID=A0AAN9I9I9_CROPI